MDDHRETEFKLRALRPIEPAALDAAIREAGLSCRAIDTRRHLDVYLDDSDRSLHRAGQGLRLRDDGTHRTLTCKDTGRRAGALFVRNETEGPWPADGLPRTAAALPDTLRDVVEPFVLDRPLLEVMRLRVDRETRRVQADGRDLCIVTLDAVQATCRERTAAFLEIEIEVLDDIATCEELATSLTSALPVRPAEEDKPSYAAALLGVALPAPPPTAAHAEAPTGATVASLLRRHLAAAASAEAGVREGRDPAPLHTMRVSLRRARSLVRTFRDAWDEPTARFVDGHLGETNRRLGGLRDLDVTIAGLEAARDELPERLRPAADRLVPWARAQRQSMHAAVREWLRSPLRSETRRRLETALAQLEHGALATTPLHEAVRPRLEKLVERAQRLVAELPRDLPLAGAHEARIAVKRLRYFAEEFVALAEPEIVKSLAAATRLQQDLGIVCDHERTMQQLVDWIPTARDGDAGALAAALGAFTTAHARAGRTARKRALRSLAKLDRKKVWRRFALAPHPG